MRPEYRAMSPCPFAGGETLHVDGHLNADDTIENRMIPFDVTVDKCTITGDLLDRHHAVRNGWFIWVTENKDFVPRKFLILIPHNAIRPIIGRYLIDQYFVLHYLEPGGKPFPGVYPLR